MEGLFFLQEYKYSVESMESTAFIPCMHEFVYTGYIIWLTMISLAHRNCILTLGSPLFVQALVSKMSGSVNDLCTVRVVECDV